MFQKMVFQNLQKIGKGREKLEKPSRNLKNWNSKKFETSVNNKFFKYYFRDLMIPLRNFFGLYWLKIPEFFIYDPLQ